MTSDQPHFSTEALGTPRTPGRFVDVSSVNPIELVDGLEFRPVLGENTMVSFVSFMEHTQAPTHAHEEEQIVIVLEGEVEFDIDGEVQTLRAGDVAVVPPWVPHGAHTLDTRCREVDIFNPPRKTLIAHAKAQEAERSTAPREQA
jgi:quercetin dioxygenase-like cupin family protein